MYADVEKLATAAGDCNEGVVESGADVPLDVTTNSAAEVIVVRYCYVSCCLCVLSAYGYILFSLIIFIYFGGAWLLKKH